MEVPNRSRVQKLAEGGLTKVELGSRTPAHMQLSCAHRSLCECASHWQVGTDGTIYFGSADGYLYAVRSNVSTERLHSKCVVYTVCLTKPYHATAHTRTGSP